MLVMLLATDPKLCRKTACKFRILSLSCLLCDPGCYVWLHGTEKSMYGSALYTYAYSITPKERLDEKITQHKHAHLPEPNKECPIKKTSLCGAKPLVGKDERGVYINTRLQHPTGKARNGRITDWPRQSPLFFAKPSHLRTRPFGGKISKRPCRTQQKRQQRRRQRRTPKALPQRTAGRQTPEPRAP